MEKIIRGLSEICMFIFIADFTNCCSVFLCVYFIVFSLFQVERFTNSSKFFWFFIRYTLAFVIIQCYIRNNRRKISRKKLIRTKKLKTVPVEQKMFIRCKKKIHRFAKHHKIRRAAEWQISRILSGITFLARHAPHVGNHICRKIFRTTENRRKLFPRMNCQKNKTPRWQ